MIDTASILDQFRTAAEARGLLLPDHLEADGKLHRCPLWDGAKGKKDGAYLLHLDGVPAGGFQIGFHDQFSSRKSADKHQQRALRQMEIRDQGVHHLVVVGRIDEDVR